MSWLDSRDWPILRGTDGLTGRQWRRMARKYERTIGAAPASTPERTDLMKLLVAEREETKRLRRVVAALEELLFEQEAEK